jgi:hypothetical protein
MLTKDFILAGKAIFTVANDKGEHYTFKITKSDGRGDKTVYFAALLSGPDNEHSYTYMGLVNEISGVPHTTAKSAYDKTSKPFKVLHWALGIVWGRNKLPNGYLLEHAGKCGRCGRTLTTPESIERGIGPECMSKLGLLF